MKPIPLLIFMLLSLVSSCNNDNDKVDNYEMEFVDLYTDASGIGITIKTDNYETFTLTNPIMGLTPDSIYRYVTLFVREGNGNARIASATQAISGYTSLFNDTPMKTDPVEMQSIWRGGPYINMTLQVKRYDKQHSFGFKNNGITNEQNGYRLLHLQLYHNNGNDVEAFSSTVYLSCLLNQFKDSLHTKRDSILVQISEYEKGDIIYRIPY